MYSHENGVDVFECTYCAKRLLCRLIPVCPSQVHIAVVMCALLLSHCYCPPCFSPSLSFFEKFLVIPTASAEAFTETDICWRWPCGGLYDVYINS